ncbi:outer membrane protein OmpA [Psychromonas sp. CNPT3]|uniref:OmpA family protein n=1 Tax=Psychromonas sp. CNPT3 TaxID=314282 RepID=UPI00006E9CAC|nr:OmpA family protein [Psychromonas sp. CNPT3]AGH80195.1 outer membrane protein OmpA [Psychromonas sp. CNPT3]
MKIKHALPLAALLVSSTAFAAHTDNDWYTGLRLGATDYTDYKISGGESSSAIDANIGGGLFLGYNFVDWFALEGGYTYLGELETSEKITNHALELVGKFTLQATDNLDLFVKAGAFGYKTDADSANDDGFNATAGFGAEYFFNDNVSTRLEYQYYNNLTLDEAKWDAHLLAVSLVYNWGSPAAIAAVAAPIVASQLVAEEPVQEKVEAVKEKVQDKMMKIASEKVQVAFPFGSSVLSEESMQQLTPVIEHLKAYPDAKLFLVGHTDASGPAEYNQTFSVKRADALATYLSEEFSIDKSRMTVSGEGESMPIATNDTTEGRAMNRRVSVFSPSFEMMANK